MVSDEEWLQHQKEVFNKEYSKLKPCPFCGEIPKSFTYQKILNVVYIVCDDEFCFIHPRTKEYENISIVIKAWNKRKEN